MTRTRPEYSVYVEFRPTIHLRLKQAKAALTMQRNSDNDSSKYPLARTEASDLLPPVFLAARRGDRAGLGNVDIDGFKASRGDGLVNIFGVRLGDSHVIGEGAGVGDGLID